MSVLSFPRIYFKGWMEWDPCTFNNNDFNNSPTYDGGRASLNWEFLGATAGITPENFQKTLRPWMRKFTENIGPTANPPGGIPAEWNMFGSHSVRFVENGNGRSTTVTSGATGPNNPVTGGDPLIGGLVTLRGDQGTPAVLVDSNPSSFWSSQIFWGSITIGSGAAAISGTRSYRMHSRWLNLFRIYNAPNVFDRPASSVACCFQTGIPFEDVHWPEAGVSSLADALRTAASAPGAQGIMVRFNAYVNLYFVNGILNNISTQPRHYKDLANDLDVAWKAWEESGGTDTSLFFSNPCYSHVVGVAGVWNEGELASAPGGRYLVIQTPVSPVGTVCVTPTGPTSLAAPAPAAQAEHNAVRAVDPGSHAGALSFAVTELAAMAATGAAAPSNAPAFLGPAVAEVNQQFGVLSIDLNSTIPECGTPGEVPSDLQKANLGPLSIGVVDSTGGFSSLGQLTYDQYGMTAYETTAGIVDIPLSVTGPLPGALAIQSQGMSQGTYALLEQPLAAQTDTRAIYLDQGEQTTFTIQVCERGVPSPNANVVVVRYGAAYQLPINYGDLNAVPTGPTAPAGPVTPGGPTGATAPAGSPPEQVIDFVGSTVSVMETLGPTGGTAGGTFTEVTTVTTDANGMATVGLSAQTPGFMVLGFFPYLGATAPPLPPALFPPNPPATNFNQIINNAYYTTVRVLPFDNDLPKQFCELWNNSHDPDKVWDFIYSPTSPSGGILYLYDMVFSVMLEHLPLGNRSAVESSATQIWAMISPSSASDGSWLMPITRDLSAGKRHVLQLWIYLVLHDYPTSPPLTPNSIDGWSPIT